MSEDEQSRTRGDLIREHSRRQEVRAIEPACETRRLRIFSAVVDPISGRKCEPLFGDVELPPDLEDFPLGDPPPDEGCCPYKRLYVAFNNQLPWIVCATAVVDEGPVLGPRFGGDVYIEWVEVSTEFRHQGYAGELLRGIHAHLGRTLVGMRTEATTVLGIGERREILTPGTKEADDE